MKKYLLNVFLNQNIYGLIHRFVVYGEAFLKTIEPFSAQPFKFSKEYRLTEAQVKKHHFFTILYCGA